MFSPCLDRWTVKWLLCFVVPNITEPETEPSRLRRIEAEEIRVNSPRGSERPTQEVPELKCLVGKRRAAETELTNVLGWLVQSGREADNNPGREGDTVANQEVGVVCGRGVARERKQSFILLTRSDLLSLRSHLKGGPGSWVLGGKLRGNPAEPDRLTAPQETVSARWPFCLKGILGGRSRAGWSRVQLLLKAYRSWHPGHLRDQLLGSSLTSSSHHHLIHNSYFNNHQKLNVLLSKTSPNINSSSSSCLLKTKIHIHKCYFKASNFPQQTHMWRFSLILKSIKIYLLFYILLLF